MPGASHPENERGGQPPCEHVPGAHLVKPHSVGCRQCLEREDGWSELWLCLSCGWTACSNDSPNRHAMAHYEETDHTVAVGLESGRRVRWCYIH
jgi:uncharacterized UBP type Zn finger protein